VGGIARVFFFKVITRRKAGVNGSGSEKGDIFYYQGRNVRTICRGGRSYGREEIRDFEEGGGRIMGRGPLLQKKRVLCLCSERGGLIVSGGRGKRIGLLGKKKYPLARWRGGKPPVTRTVFVYSEDDPLQEGARGHP